ncbi:double-stranded RNA-specific editase 1-like isoform X2 [Phymastichus coffea]|uniref:double-stranded RNA-specific editase 1-like isoform X2 n=1 Tax=Phymastichus coffea TaxID=108790 RepID=UPI00273A839C|nr:double-stranded RNA-specific editase 1-like isoform X2 [Phymastichus coffea]
MNLEYYRQGKMAFYPKFATSSSKQSANQDDKNNIMNNKNDINDLDTYIPRDAVNILNELKPGLTYTLVHSVNDIIGSVEVDSKIYYGNGKSDLTAKQSAAEAALRDLFFDMIFATMTDSDDTDSYNTNSWKLLGSLAMFKLLEEWLLFYMSEKTHKKDIPNCPPKKPPSQSSLKNEISKIKITRDLKIEKKIPPADSNPCVILNALLGTDLKFVDMKVNSNKPPFTFSITLDDIEYVGESAGNKKDAKQNVARKVLIKKYGYNYTKQ